MVAPGAKESVAHAPQALQRGVPRDPAALHRDDQGHDAEARATDRDPVVGQVLARGADERAAVERQAAVGLRTVPEIAEGLPLHGVDQGFIGQGSQCPRTLVILQHEWLLSWLS
ncbi:hypothetical protein D9M69_594210 [compost metagenome]